MSVEQLDQRAIARGIIESLSDDKIVLKISGSDYRLHLKPAVPASEIETPVGKRIKGTIRAKAMRIHPFHGGGKFIEPVWGEPRIVAGRVLAVDEAKRELLVDLVVPVTVEAKDDQDMGVCTEGSMVTFYVESGTSFTPVKS